MFHQFRDENRGLLGSYAANSGNFVPTFRDNRSRLPETSVINYHYLLRNNSEERNSHLLRDEITNFAKFRPALRHDPSISLNASSQRSLISKDKHLRYDKKYAALFTFLNPTVSNVHRSSTVQINIQRFEE